MTEVPSASLLVLALTDPGQGMRPGGARLNAVSAGLVRMHDGWQGVIRATWSPSEHQQVQAGLSETEASEAILKTDTLWIWPPKDIEKADHEIGYAAWKLGAWDVMRCWHQPLGARADPLAPHHGLTSLFGSSCAYAVLDGPMAMRGDRIDTKALIETAAQDGWISWRFRPTFWSSRAGGKVAARDITLAIDGTRIAPYPYCHKALIRGERLVIPLGREDASTSDPWALSNQGATLRDARQRLGISADGLAARLRLGSNGDRTVRRWEAGEVPISGPAQVAIELLLDGDGK